MNGYNMSSFEVTIEELDMELIAREAQASLATLLQFTDKEGSPQREEDFRSPQDFTLLFFLL